MCIQGQTQARSRTVGSCGRSVSSVSVCHLGSETPPPPRPHVSSGTGRRERPGTVTPGGALTGWRGPQYAELAQREGTAAGRQGGLSPRSCLQSKPPRPISASWLAGGGPRNPPHVCWAHLRDSGGQWSVPPTPVTPSCVRTGRIRARVSGALASRSCGAAQASTKEGLSGQGTLWVSGVAAPDGALLVGPGG